MRPRYEAIAEYISQHYAGGVWFAVLTGFVLGLYLATTLIDQVRQLLWRRLFSPLLDRVESAVANRLRS